MRKFLLFAASMWLNGYCTVSASPGERFADKKVICPTLAPSVSSVSCHDNGTAANAGDDYITFMLDGDAAKGDLEHSYSVSATQGGSPVAVTLSDGSSASGLYFGFESPIRTPTGTAGHGNITLTITSNGGCTGTVTLSDPGTCSSAATPCSPGSVSYTYRTPFQSTQLVGVPLVIPKFDTNGGTRTLTGVDLGTSYTMATAFVAENTSGSGSQYAREILNGEATVKLAGSTLQSYSDPVLNSGLISIGHSVLVPAGTNGSSWPGDTPEGLGTLFTLVTSESLGLTGYMENIFADPTLSSAWVTNVTGLASTDDDMIHYLGQGSHSSSSSYTAAPDLAMFSGSGDVGLTADVIADNSFTALGGNVRFQMFTKAYATATVTYTYSCAVLPVKLITFEGKVNKDKVNLGWKTAEETDFSHFEVKKSLNARDFETVGTVRGGISTGEYSFIDTDVAEGDNYYQLKMVDLDGSSALSKLISVYYEKDGDYLMIENPSAGGVINLKTNMTQPVFELTTVLGVKVGLQSRVTDANQYALSVSNTLPGQYYLTVRDIGNKVVTKRVLIQ